MKILAVNGSGRSMGNTAALLEACGKVMPEDVEFETAHLAEYS